MIHKTAAFGAANRAATPLCAQQDLLRVGRIDFPDFLDTDAVVLRIGMFSQIKFLHQNLPEIAVHALGKNCVLAEQFVTRLVGRLFLTVFAYAQSLVATPVTRPSASYRTSDAAKPGNTLTPMVSI